MFIEKNSLGAVFAVWENRYLGEFRYKIVESVHCNRRYAKRDEEEGIKA
jgi:hypothetical protein